MAVAINVGVYKTMLDFKSRKPLLTKSEFTIAYGYYSKNIATLRQYLVENKIYFNKSLHYEQNCKGLIIKEAYFGLDEHIF